MKIITIATSGNKIQIADEDLHDLLSWEDVKIACENLGKGWRLPNKDELNEMFKLKDVIGKFCEKTQEFPFDNFIYYYWASDYHESDFSIAFGQCFNGENYYAKYFPRDFTFSVRAVKDC